ncbi:MAG: DUF4426 domain-containing protein [Gammaproteobacteria bacterium]|nr:DUF4426 domain-containing protein [Gammaproteobacteria bacterium]
MTSIKRYLINTSLVLCSLLALNAYAENSKTFGDYIVHYNAFRSDTLTPEIAKAYQLTRRNNRMVINITVLKKDNMHTTPVKAKISGFASNLTGQVKDLEFKEVVEENAIYYLAQAQVSHRETLKFEIKATPEGQHRSTRVKFDQQFFTD